ncbi:hypothetical protein P7K49_024480 [Saguinus oedipus]|uniref:Uncharacterized protein n=1 Tax=Saguinus oedipus TaxID=9490 RepID=A0ABQ9UPL5_SAGOE|nr:hypothetical protein P7K49_024480 [Saguinus oedipus]
MRRKHSLQNWEPDLGRLLPSAGLGSAQTSSNGHSAAISWELLSHPELSRPNYLLTEH